MLGRQRTHKLGDDTMLLKTCANSTFEIRGVLCFADSFVVAECTFVVKSLPIANQRNVSCHHKIDTMTKCKLILLIVLILNSCVILAQNDNESFDKMMHKCQAFVDNYKPTYVIGTDTLVVSRFTLPPDDLNKFLFDCIKKGDFRPLKYSCVIVMNQSQEYSNVNHEDYLLDEPSYAKNGFLELLRTKMGLPKNEQDYIAPMFTGDLCKWIHDNKSVIYDYQYIDKFLKKK